MIIYKIININKNNYYLQTIKIVKILIKKINISRIKLYKILIFNKFIKIIIKIIKIYLEVNFKFKNIFLIIINK